MTHPPPSDFAKGPAAGSAGVYDTSPTGLGISPSYLAGGASATASASGGGAAAAVAIYDNTLVSSSFQIVVAGISQLYAHLMIVFSGRSDLAAAFDGVNVKFNGDSGSHYYELITSSNGAGSTGAEVNASGAFGFTLLAAVPAASATANCFGITRMTVADYTNTTRFKNVEAVGHMRWGAGAGNHVIRTAGGEWAQTSAITTIEFDANAGSFVAGTRLTIYGMGV